MMNVVLPKEFLQKKETAQNYIDEKAEDDKENWCISEEELR